MTAGHNGGRRRGALLVLGTAVAALGVLAGCGLPGSASALGIGAETAAPAPTSAAAAPTTTEAATSTETAPTTSEAAPTTAAAATTAALAPSPGTGAAAITIVSFMFGPATLTVPAGATVMVMNQDGANHTVTAMDGSFDTGNIPGKATAMFTAPSKPGSYAYKCAIHPFMTGTLVVS